GGLFPRLDGSFPTEYVEQMFTGKATRNINARQYVSGRYARNTNRQPYGTSAVNPPNNWASSDNRFNSFNLNHNWVLPGAKLNEFIFQFANFQNRINPASSTPNEVFPNGVTFGANSNTPQTTEQHKF